MLVVCHSSLEAICDVSISVLAISEHDAERFRKIGLPPERISVMGNLKVDVDIGDRFDARERAQLKQTLGLGDGFVLLGSSTWPGEEAALLRALRAAYVDRFQIAV